MRFIPFFLLFACSFCLSLTGSGQNVLLQSDFEYSTGTTNWQFAQANQANLWTAGTETASSGTQSLYITNAGTYTYDIVSTSVSHIYTDLPLGSNDVCLTVSFDWKGEGEPKYDQLRVFLIEVDVIPVGGIKLADNQLIGIDYHSQNSWQKITLNVNPTSTSHRRLVFSWENDNSLGTNPPAAIDNVVVSSKTPNLNPPQCVAQLSPAEGSMLGCESSINFRWNAALSPYECSNGLIYNLYLTEGDTTTIFSISDTSLFILNSLKKGSQYTWRVLPENNQGEAIGCPSRSFSTSSQTPLPNCPAGQFIPANGSTNLCTDNNLVLDWPNSTSFCGEPTLYDLYLSKGTVADTLYRANLSASQTSLPPLQIGTQYAWKIVPKNTTGSANNCPTQTFTTRLTSVPTSLTLPFFDNLSGCNNWILADQGQNEKWIIGQPTGTNNNSIYVDRQPDNVPPSIIHFYNNITIPPTHNCLTTGYNYQLNPFPSPVAGSGLYVSLVPASYVPTPGTNIPQEYVLYRYSSGSSDLIVIPIIPGSDRTRIVFSWDNTNYQYSPNAIYFDDIRISSQQINSATPLSCPTLTGPPNNFSFACGNTQNLLWQQNANNLCGTTALFDIYLNEGTTASTVVAQNQVMGEHTIPTLEPGKQYAWKIVPKNAFGSLTTCPTRVFQTGSIKKDTCVTYRSPLPDEKDICPTSTTLTWHNTNPIACSKAYMFSVYLDKGDMATTLVADSLLTNTFKTGNLEPNTEYTWRVLMKQIGDSTTKSCEIRRFTTGDGIHPNDLPCNAKKIELGATYGGNNTCTGNDQEPPKPPCFSSGVINSIWYKVVCPPSGAITIRTSLNTLLNSQISLYSGNCDSLTYVGCNDNAAMCGGTLLENSELTMTNLSPGASYYIMVDGFEDMVGTFNITVIDTTTEMPRAIAQDCGNNIYFCKQTTNYADPGFQSVGNKCDLPGNYCLVTAERGSSWHTIPILSDGTFKFDIVPNDYGTPNPFTGFANPTYRIVDDETDYDFALWKISDTVSCSTIRAGNSIPVSCDYDVLGVTGLNGTGDAPAAYPGYDKAYQPEIEVKAGEIYYLNISNFAKSTSGFTIQFGGTATIDFNQTPGTLAWSGGSKTKSPFWNDFDNWGGCALPRCAVDAVVLPFSIQPRITASMDTVTVNTLTINPAATLTLDSGAVLKICGNLVNYGTIIAHPKSTILFMDDRNTHVLSGNFSGNSRLGILKIQHKGNAANTCMLTVHTDLNLASDLLIVNEKSIFNLNEKNLSIQGNIYNAAGINTFTGTEANTITWNGNKKQHIELTAISKPNLDMVFNHVVIENNEGVNLGKNNKPHFVIGEQGSLSLNLGVLTIPDSQEVVVRNTATTSVSKGDTSSFVVGSLRRFFASNATGDFDFPLGDSLKGFEKMRISFSTPTSGALQVVASFRPWGDSLKMPLAVESKIENDCQHLNLFTHLDHGYWHIGSVGSNTTAHNLTLFNRNFTPRAGSLGVSQYATSSKSWTNLGNANSLVADSVVKNQVTNFAPAATNIFGKDTLIFPTSFRITASSPLCINGFSKLHIDSTVAGFVYRIYDGEKLTDSIMGTGDTLSKSVLLSTAGKRILKVYASKFGCQSQTANSSDTVLVSPEVRTNLTVSTNSPICSGSLAQVTIVAAQNTIRYQVREGLTLLADTTHRSQGNFTIAIANLAEGLHAFTITAISPGCASKNLAAQPSLLVLQTPTGDSLLATATSVCSSSDSATVVLQKTAQNISYEIRLRGTTIGKRITSLINGQTLTIKIPNSALQLGNNTLNVVGLRAGCSDSSFVKTVNITKNSEPDSRLKLLGDTVCTNSSNATLSILQAKAGESYSIWLGTKAIAQSAPSVGNNRIISMPVDSLRTGNNTLKARADIEGCETVTLADSASILVNTPPDINLKIWGDTVCIESNLTPYVNLSNSQINVTYLAYLANGNNRLLGEARGNGGSIKIPIDRTLLVQGGNSIEISAQVKGCQAVSMKEKTTIWFVPQQNEDMAVSNINVCGFETFNLAQALGIMQVHIYTFLLSGRPILKLNPDFGQTSNFDFPIDSLSFGRNKITIRVTIKGCTDVLLKDSMVVTIIKPINLNAKAIGDTICSNDATGTVRVLNTEPHDHYSLWLASTQIGTSTPSVNGKSEIAFLTNNLQLGLNKLTLKSGCRSEVLKDTAYVVVNELANTLHLSTSGDTICANSAQANVTVKGTKPNEQLMVLAGSDILAVSTPSLGGTLTIAVPRNKLKLGPNKLALKVTISGCDTLALRDSALVVVNDLANTDFLTLSGDTICSTDSEATVLIGGVKAGEQYRLNNGLQIISTAKATQAGQLKITIPRSSLSAGMNLFTTFVSLQGCRDIQLKDTAKVLLNQLPDRTIKALGDTVCTNASSVMLTINGSKNGEMYSAYLNGKLMGDSAQSINDTTTLILPLTKFKKDTLNLLDIAVSLQGCDKQWLNSKAEVLINSSVNDLNLIVTGDTICSNTGSAVVLLKGTTKNATYQANKGASLISLPRTATQTEEEFDLIIPRDSLAIGQNIITFTGAIKGCIQTALAKSTQVLVNALPNGTLSLLHDTVCNNSLFAKPVVLGTRKGEKYQAFEDGKPVGQAISSKGDSLILLLPIGSNLGQLNPNIQQHKLSVSASIDGCATVFMNDSTSVIINPLPNLNASTLIGSGVCREQDAMASITKSQTSLHYTIMVNDLAMPAQKGNGDTLTITVPQDALTKLENKISFRANIAGCETVSSTEADSIFVFAGENMAITGATILCMDDTGSYSVNPQKGAVGYAWSVEKGSIIEGQGTRFVSIRTETENIRIAVSPKGIHGVCDMEVADYSVKVEERMQGNGYLQAKDTVCVFDRDTVQLLGIRGASSVRWNWPSHIELDTIEYPTSFLVQYLQTGIKTIEAIPFSRCANVTGKPIVQRVFVLENALAEANDYAEGQSMDGIPLNGSGSSIAIAEDTVNRYAYRWFAATATPAFIANPNSLNSATLIPTLEYTKVYLKVTNQERYCAALDSAILVTQTKIMVPNVFSPNNDGVHDTWNIANLATLYPNAEVEVFNKWGHSVWKSGRGYPEPWSGKRNGQPLPMSTYYYVLDFNNGEKPKLGSVTILK
jgi:gliding motility-associated-like protein